MLYRKEAIDNKLNKTFGSATAFLPFSARFWCVVIFIIALLIIIFIYFGSYQRKHVVKGSIISEKGLINIYSNKSGVILKKLLNHNESIKKGQLLYVVSLEEDQYSLSQILFIKKKIKLQEKRVNESEYNLLMYGKLLQGKLITRKEYNKHIDWSLSLKVELEKLKADHNNAQNKMYYEIYAPIDGVVVGLFSNLGDRVTPEKVLASVYPDNSNLYAELILTSKIIGSVNTGQKVLLKYSSYPYQEFGIQKGYIVKIDKAPIILYEPNSNSFNLPNHSFYKVIAKLEKQFVYYNGHKYELIPGMLLEAIILGERKTFLQWISKSICKPLLTY